MTDGAFWKIAFGFAVLVVGVMLAGLLHEQTVDCRSRGGVMVDDGGWWFACVQPVPVEVP